MLRNGLTIVIGVAVILFAALVIPSDVWRQAFTTPWQAILGTERQLHATLIDVSQTGDPLVQATRRLLKPLGEVTLIRVYPATDSPEQKTDLHNP